MQDPTLNLVKMANQIAAYFTSQSREDSATAARAVAGHLKMFWAPSMRERLLDNLDQPVTAGLLPVVREALITHAALLSTPTQRTPAAAGEVFPQGGGDAG
jgi:formate dehydrogenase subunit delta